MIISSAWELIFTADLNHLGKMIDIMYNPNKPFSEFPLEIDQWKGQKGELDQEVYNILGVEDYILANYRKISGEMVTLYVGFYQSQKEGDIIHSPKNCMPGAGWKITDTSIETNKIYPYLNEHIPS